MKKKRSSWTVTAIQVPGHFCRGGCHIVKNKQIIIAAGDGAKAAFETYEYLMKTAHEVK